MNLDKFIEDLSRLSLGASWGEWQSKEGMLSIKILDGNEKVVGFVKKGNFNADLITFLCSLQMREDILELAKMAQAHRRHRHHRRRRKQRK